MQAFDAQLAHRQNEQDKYRYSFNKKCFDCGLDWDGEVVVVSPEGIKEPICLSCHQKQLEA